MVSNLIVLALVLFSREAWVKDFSSGILKTIDVTLNGDELNQLSNAFRNNQKITFVRAATKLVNSNSMSSEHFITIQFFPILNKSPLLRISGECDLRKNDDHLIYFRSIDYKNQNSRPEEINNFIDFIASLPEKRLEMKITQKVFFGMWSKDVLLKIELVNDSKSFLIEAIYL